MRKVIKPKFGYLYLAFIVSLAIVVITSLLFHQRMNKMKVEEGYFNTISIWAGLVTLVAIMPLNSPNPANRRKLGSVTGMWMALGKRTPI